MLLPFIVNLLESEQFLQDLSYLHKYKANNNDSQENLLSNVENLNNSKILTKSKKNINDYNQKNSEAHKIYHLILVVILIKIKEYLKIIEMLLQTNDLFSLHS